MNAILRSLLHLLRRSRHDADLLEEIETHRALRQYALQRDGLDADDAARASKRAMGNVTLAVEDAREVWMARAVTRALLRAPLRLGAMRRHATTYQRKRMNGWHRPSTTSTSRRHWAFRQ